MAVLDDVEPGRAGVAERAAAMVGPTDTIALDAGPTALALARALPVDFRGSVITHSMPVLRLLDEQPSGATVVALGGELLADRHAFVGPATEAALEPLRARTFFVSPAAVDERGLYARTPAEASVQRRLIGIADRVVLVATHEVYTTSAPARIAPLDRLTALVSDRPPPPAIAAALRRVDATTDIVAAGRMSLHNCHAVAGVRNSQCVRVRELLIARVNVRFAPHNCENRDIVPY